MKKWLQSWKGILVIGCIFAAVSYFLLYAIVSYRVMDSSSLKVARDGCLIACSITTLLVGYLAQRERKLDEKHEYEDTICECGHYRLYHENKFKSGSNCGSINKSSQWQHTGEGYPFVTYSKVEWCSCQKFQEKQKEVSFGVSKN